MVEKASLTKIDCQSESAYSQLYMEYFSKLYNYGKKLTNDSQLVQDSIQEVFLDFWTKKEKLASAGNLSAYFFSSFRYVLLRNRKRQDRFVSDDKLPAEPDFSIDHFLMAREAETELQQKIHSALQTLTPRQREAIFLRFYEGLSYEEVASVLQISVKATYKIMARSIDALKEVLLCPVVICLLASFFTG